MRNLSILHILHILHILLCKLYGPWLFWLERRHPTLKPHRCCGPSPGWPCILGTFCPRHFAGHGGDWLYLCLLALPTHLIALFDLSGAEMKQKNQAMNSSHDPAANEGNCSPKLSVTWVFFVVPGKEGAFMCSSINICHTTFLSSGAVYILTVHIRTSYVIKLGRHESPHEASILHTDL